MIYNLTFEEALSYLKTNPEKSLRCNDVNFTNAFVKFEDVGELPPREEWVAVKQVTAPTPYSPSIDEVADPTE